MKAQVDDVLWFPFKFTRLVNGKRVTVGAKQEAVIKLKQCIEGTDEPAIYLIRDEINTSASSSITVEASTSQDADTEKKDFDSPPPKKSKISQQPTLFDLLSPGRSMDKKPKAINNGYNHLCGFVTMFCYLCQQNDSNKKNSL